ncbi:hypothetical protein L1887_44479 [Cichorium endivia]|nr:hypothetical protein L1887_44479 [Cichorium endivia]
MGETQSSHNSPDVDFFMIDTAWKMNPQFAFMRTIEGHKVEGFVYNGARSISLAPHYTIQRLIVSAN